MKVTLHKEISNDQWAIINIGNNKGLLEIYLDCCIISIPCDYYDLAVGMIADLNFKIRTDGKVEITDED